MMSKVSYFFAFVLIPFFCILPLYEQARPRKYTNNPNFDLPAAFEKERITPHYVKIPPKELCEVDYDLNKVVGQGNIISLELVRITPPKVTWAHDNNSFYTVMIMDLDWHFYPYSEMSEWCIWLVVDIPGGNLTAGRVLCPYFAGDEYIASGMHRFVTLVYQQPNSTFPLEFEDVIQEIRWIYTSKDLSRDYGLGNPIAANYFIVDARKRKENVWRERKT